MPKEVVIDSHCVGDGKPVFVIAEIGSNHNQSISTARELIDAAAEAGADAVKFQLFRAENFYAPSEPSFAIMKENELQRDWIDELSSHCKRKRILFLASPFDLEAVDLLESVNSPAIKIASSDAINFPLLIHAARTGKPLLVSTGMCSLADVYEAVEVIRSTGNNNIVILQCASLYPSDFADLNLRAMQTMRAAFDLNVGFSDHTLRFYTPILAVALGACVVEKHVTMSRSLPGPDHSYALEPAEFKQMVIAIREAEKSLGTQEKKMLVQERLVARRVGFSARHGIAKGETLSDDMLLLRRPALGVDERFQKALVGQPVKRALEPDEPITWEVLGK